MGAGGVRASADGRTTATERRRGVPPGFIEESGKARPAQDGKKFRISICSIGLAVEPTPNRAAESISEAISRPISGFIVRSRTSGRPGAIEASFVAPRQRGHFPPPCSVAYFWRNARACAGVMGEAGG
jgi:hypothetical protein